MIKTIISMWWRQRFGACLFVGVCGCVCVCVWVGELGEVFEAYFFSTLRLPFTLRHDQTG